MPRPRQTVPPFASLSPQDLAGELRSLDFGPIGVAMIRADLKGGAPALPDGSIDPVHYAAWLIRERGDRAETE